MTLPPQMRETKDPNTFKTMMNNWIWDNIPLSWDCLFLFWGDANGKFTYVPKYKPEISKTGLY